MSELVFNEIRADTQNFIEHGASHRAETVARHFIFLEAHAAESGEDCVVTHRADKGARTRKYETAFPGLRMEFFQDIDRLPRQRNQMRLPHFHPLRRNGPFRLFEIDFGPLRPSQLSWSDKNQRSEPQCALRSEIALIVIDGPQQPSDLVRVSYCGEVAGDTWRQRSLQVLRRVPICAPGCDGIPESLATVEFCPGGRFAGATAFDAPQKR